MNYCGVLLGDYSEWKEAASAIANIGGLVSCAGIRQNKKTVPRVVTDY